MQAYKVKKGSKVVVIDENVETPPASLPVNKGDEITIYKPDGMYCNGENKDGNMVFIGRFTEVELINYEKR